jgi:hypothetical protein
MSTASILNDFGIPWPDADTGSARDAAAAWKALAQAANDALSQTSSAAQALGEHNSGPAMDSFNKYWDGIGGTPYACTASGQNAMLNVLIEACDALSTGCTSFADAVDEEKTKLEETAAEIGAALAAGAAATLFTLGISDAVSTGTAMALASTAIGSIEVLGTTIADIVGTMAVGLVFGSVDAIFETTLGNGIKTQLGEQPDSPLTNLEDLGTSAIVGALTFGFGDVATNAVKMSSLAGLAALPDSVSTIVPDLPAILAAMPDAADSVTGQALLKLSGGYAANTAVNSIQGKSTDPPSLQEILGEILDSKIEGAADAGGEK